MGKAKHVFGMVGIYKILGLYLIYTCEKYVRAVWRVGEGMLIKGEKKECSEKTAEGNNVSHRLFTAFMACK